MLKITDGKKVVHRFSFRSFTLICSVILLFCRDWGSSIINVSIVWIKGLFCQQQSRRTIQRPVSPQPVGVVVVYNMHVREKGVNPISGGLQISRWLQMHGSSEYNFIAIIGKPFGLRKQRIWVYQVGNMRPGGCQLWVLVFRHATVLFMLLYLVCFSPFIVLIS